MSEPLILIPFTHGARGSVAVPGSKSLTNRALLLCSLAEGESVLDGCLESEDSEVMQAALKTLGVTLTKKETRFTVGGRGGSFLSGDHEIYLGNSGTSMRFLTAAAALGKGRIRLYGKPRMHERPIGDLLEGLTQLGVIAISEAGTGCPPVIVEAGGGFSGGDCRISGAVSSQFLSAILHVAALARQGVTLHIIPPLVSEPYLLMTIRLLAHYGVCVERPEPLILQIKPQPLQAVHMTIEGDASGAAHVFALAVAAGGEITITNFPGQSLQGDAAFLEVVRRLGGEVISTANGTAVRMAGPIKPLGECDLEKIPDAGMSAVVLAALAKGRSRLTGLSTLRQKECDRVEALRLNLARMGAKVAAGPDFIEIEGDPALLHGAEIETFDDHRVAMSFAALATRVPGVIIKEPDCVGKTFPSFWQIFEACRG
jgi:3-phosphoshikimate 1-carboxyvinyltransferase